MNNQVNQKDTAALLQEITRELQRIEKSMRLATHWDGCESQHRDCRVRLLLRLAHAEIEGLQREKAESGCGLHAGVPIGKPCGECLLVRAEAAEARAEAAEGQLTHARYVWGVLLGTIPGHPTWKAEMDTALRATEGATE